MTHTAEKSMQVIRSTSWIAAARRAATSWYPRIHWQGSSLVAHGLRRLQAIRFDRTPRIGRMTGIGLLLLTASGVLFVSTVLPLTRSVAILEVEAARLEAAARSGTATIRSPSAQYDAFVKRLPTQPELPAILTVVVNQATDAGLELVSGRYEFTPAKSGKIARYRLAFPVRGSYPQLRRFIDGTLGAVPAVALEGLRLERASVEEEVLDADLRFEVVVRSGT
ncbi:MAG: type 4a pilus biogenesis protein PilO [Gammaproteobacteria bacterium]|nr:type 4a pilus biogenesis protein PilO [Gammaproteobacteria bacterium]